MLISPYGCMKDTSMGASPTIWSPLPLDRIQGDIQPLLSHLRFQTRFRRPDLIAVIDRFHAKRSRLAPSSATEYRPREANFVADYLAGRGSASLHRTEALAASEGITEHDAKVLTWLCR